MCCFACDHSSSQIVSRYSVLKSTFPNPDHFSLQLCNEFPVALFVMSYMWVCPLPLQGHKQATEDLAAAVQALDLTETESDTDSICTPSESPYKNRESTSSFGLHSPDNLIPRVGQDTLQELWKRLKAENSDLTCDSIYLDPDIIDLTFIPPPILSAEESVISEASFPPRSFADHANFPDYQDKIVGMSKIAPEFIP